MKVFCSLFFLTYISSIYLCIFYFSEILNLQYVKIPAYRKMQVNHINILCVLHSEYLENILSY